MLPEHAIPLESALSSKTPVRHLSHLPQATGLQCKDSKNSRLLAREQLLSQARDEMKRRMNDPDLSLQDIASSLFVSSRHLQRLFAQSDSKGFCYELAGMRVRYAAELIYRDPSLSVAEAAQLVGYRQASFFAKTFKAHLKRQPGEWRKHCRLKRQMQVAQRQLELRSEEILGVN